MRIKILVLFIMFSMKSFSQNSFEGVLKYKVGIELLDGYKKMGISKEDFIKGLKEQGAFFNEIEYAYKDGNYQILTINKNKKRKQIYLKNTNKTYFFEDDMVIVTDASIDLETKKGNIPKVEILDETQIVFGEKCNIVKVGWKTGTYYYYYKKGFLSMDSSLFTNYNYDMWYGFLKISNALPLKIVKKVNGFMTTTMTLSSYKEKEINNKIFQLPKMHKDIELSSYGLSHQEVFVVD